MKFKTRMFSGYFYNSIPNKDITIDLTTNKERRRRRRRKTFKRKQTLHKW